MNSLETSTLLKLLDNIHALTTYKAWQNNDMNDLRLNTIQKISSSKIYDRAVLAMCIIVAWKAVER